MGFVKEKSVRPCYLYFVKLITFRSKFLKFNLIFINM